MQLNIEDILDSDNLNDLAENGYAVGQLQLNDLMLHIVFIEVRYDEDDEDMLIHVSNISGVSNDVDAIFDLMGDSAGQPMLLGYAGKEYLVGAMPYAR